MNPKISDWQGKRVWLLGASSGIGAALGQLLLARGARVVFSARHVERLSDLTNGAEHALLLPCDAAD